MRIFLLSLTLTLLLGLTLSQLLLRRSFSGAAEFYDMRPIADAYCFVQGSNLECITFKKEGN